MKRIPLIDDIFLRLESRRLPLNIGALMLFEPPADAGSDFADAIVSRLRQYTTTAPPFNQILVRRNGLHYWEIDTDFDLDQHFVDLSLPGPGRIRELLAMASRIHAGHLDRAYPLWRMHLIEGIADGRFAVYLKIHHAIVDGVSCVKMLIDSMSTDPKESTTMPPPWTIGVQKPELPQPYPLPTPAAGSLSALQSLAREDFLSSAKSLVQVAQELRSTYTDFSDKNPDLAIAGQAPQCMFNTSVTASRRIAAQSYSAPRIKAVARSCNASSNDVILAMCAGAMRRYLELRNELPDNPLIAAIPVSVRREGYQSEAANQVSFTMANLATHLKNPLERLRAIKGSMDYNKQRIRKLSPGQYSIYAAMMMLPGVPNSLLGYDPDKAVANVCISHVPGPREDMYWQGAKLSGLYPISQVMDGGALNITVVSRHDLVDFGIIACRKSVPEVQRLLEYLEEELAEMEAMLKSGIMSQPGPKDESEAKRTPGAKARANTRSKARSKAKVKSGPRTRKKTQSEAASNARLKVKSKSTRKADQKYGQRAG